MAQRMIKIIMFFLITESLAMPGVTETKNQITNENITSISKDCFDGVFSVNCIKLGVLTVIERLDKKENINIIPGIDIVREIKSDDKEVIANDLKLILQTKNVDKLDKYMIYSIGKYLDSHSVKLKFFDKSSLEKAKNMISEARGKGGMSLGGKKGGAGAIMAMALMFKGTLISLALGALTLLAGKALLAALMSLLLSAIIGLKSLAGGKGSTTYEIVSKPVYSHSHTHSSAHEDAGAYGGYGRNLKQRRR